MVSYAIQRGRWCDVIVLNAHVPTEDKRDYTIGSFYEELQRILHQFPKYGTKKLLGDFSAKWNEKIFSKKLFWNESLHETGNGKGFTTVHLPQQIPNFHIEKLACTWVSLDGKKHKLLLTS
jgi:hypothetical protein